MNRYEVRVVCAGGTQSYSAHRIESIAVDRMSDVAHLPYVRQALVVDRENAFKVIARAERQPDGRIKVWWAAAEQATSARPSGRSPTP